MNAKYRDVLVKYWISHQFDIMVGGKNKKRWSTLSHNGVIFPPHYVSHGTPLLYDGNKVYLDPVAEEIATIYAKYLESDYFKNPVFRKNFWKDFKKLVKDTEIKDFDKCNFELLRQYVLKQKEQQKSMPKDVKEQEKKIRDEAEAKYKVAIVDGKTQPTGNYRVEPPGIFIGRGCHPKLGHIKPRLLPKDIIINIGKGEPIPVPNIQFDKSVSKWKEVIHDKNVEWLASWHDPISNRSKYVWLGSQSDFKAESDQNKFDLARKLKKKIKTIRKENMNLIKNGTLKEKQVATALYFIDNLALRVGNEKGSDEADTVGVTSLRVEHIKISDSNDITLDFLGKDSIRYTKTISVLPEIKTNLILFSANKSMSTDLFDLITSADMNKYLQGYMKNLTAKVFRTFNASYLFQKELKKATKNFDQSSDKINFLYDEFNKANAKVALLCNHQKKITDSFNTQITKINTSIKEAKAKKKLLDKSKSNYKVQKQKLDKKIKELKARKDVKVELKGVSLGTSKTNYIDPRITVAFMKRHNIAADKLFSKVLQEKFWWAFEVDADFKF